MEPKQEGYSFREYATFIYFGKTDHWSAFLYKIPKSLTRFTLYMGTFLIPALSFAGIVSSLM
mgnify:CR=1 FL=1